MSDSDLLERLMPRYDAVRVEREVLAGGVDAVWAAVRDADFMRTPPAMPVGTTPQPRSMRLSDMPRHGEWVVLGEVPPHEIAFGAIGRFWAGETRWEQIDADEFSSFAAPGLAKVASGFTLHACPEGGTLVTYECRALATDPSTRRAFMRYWRTLSPFIGVVLRGQLWTIETTLEEASRHG